MRTALAPASQATGTCVVTALMPLLAVVFVAFLVIGIALPVLPLPPL